MKKNVGAIDKIIRLIIAFILGLLIFRDDITGTWAIIAGIVAAIMFITALTGFCGLYKLFGCNTCPVNKKNK